MQTAYILTRDFFNFAFKVKEQEEFESIEKLQQQFCDQIDRIKMGAKDFEISPHQTEEIMYALVAFTDDLMLAKPNCREEWVLHLLQTKYFNENRAGENFFNHLRDTPRDTHHTSVLAVYYFCLQFGFQGQFVIETNKNVLQEVIIRLRQDLFRLGEIENNSPVEPWQQVFEQPFLPSKNNKLIRIATGTFVFSLLVYGTFQLHLHTLSQTVIEQLDAMASPR